MRVVAVDLFCGAGGLTYGLEKTGINVVAGVDIDPDCRYPYDTNTDAEFLQRDIKGLLDEGTRSEVQDLTLDEVRSLYPENSIKAIVGCAPCQPFSELNNGEESSDHDNWGLLEAMRRVAAEIEPEIVAIENVRGLLDDEIYVDGFRRWFDEHEEYEVWDGIIDCSDYGVPQSRQRLVMLASKLGDIELIPSTHSEEDIVSVRRTFAKADLPDIGPGDAASDVDPMHKAAGLRGKNPERMRHTREGEDWHVWPDRLKLDSQDDDNSYTAYGRMWWDKPAPTLTTQFFNWGSGRFGHPGFDEDPDKSTDRAISLREGALLQTFPPDYEFVEEDVDPVNRAMGRLIGNAVPVRVGCAIGGSIRRHLHHIGTDAEFTVPSHSSTVDDSLPAYDRLMAPQVCQVHQASIELAQPLVDASKVS